ncbi:hypothetical protein NBRC10512_005410 [Rhodotorula toruloides]|uniref:RHTO0S01e10000g1_1 n=2 Tax=Rhodotorula toruloides TaxID=5286 RepID=A0A061AEG1_RHOTO|nr:uncharacterized protein RHTO_04813 [Rhodotorula toruloides NP11]EMS24634.1 hypothetical protein RHTO_04813 [Rhodotorula toruloides NP11]CDR35912.1 RHTO0S01e10000g1_1 [Rhodotorula toruloides]
MPPAYSDSGSDAYNPSDGTSSASTESASQSLRIPRRDLVDYLSDDDLPPSAAKLPTPSDIVYSRQIPQARLAKSRLVKVLRREPAIGEEETTGEVLGPTEGEDEPEGGEEYQDGGEAMERSSSSAAATVAAEAQVAAQEGDGAPGERVDGASVEGEAEGVEERSEPSVGSEQAEEEEDDEDDEEPSFGPAVQAVHSIASIAELDRKFEAVRRRSTWFNWNPNLCNTKTKRQPFIMLGDPALKGRNVQSEPTLKIDTLVTIREEAAAGGEKKAIKYYKKENLPAWWNEYPKIFGPLRRESARFISAVLQVCANDSEVDEVMHDSNFDGYRASPGETTLFTAIRNDIEKIFDKDKGDYPEPNLITKLCALLVDGYEQDGVATSTNGEMPRLSDPSGENHKQFAYGAVGVGALIIGVRLLRPHISATSSYIAFKRNSKLALTMLESEDRIRLGFPRAKGQAQRLFLELVTDQAVPPPPPPTQPPLLTFPFLPTDPPDARGRLRSYRPDLSPAHIERAVYVLGWINHVLASMGITALENKQKIEFWKDVRARFYKTPVPRARDFITFPERRVAYTLHTYAGQGQAIYRGKLIRDDGSGCGERMEGGWRIFDPILAQSAVELGNKIFRETNDYIVAERRMAAHLDLGELVLDENEIETLLEHPRVYVDADTLTCAGCGEAKPLTDFPDADADEVYSYNRILCLACGPATEGDAFSPRYDVFRSLRKIRAREGIDRSTSTPKSLARDYDGCYGFDFESGMGFDLYSQLPIAIATDEPTVVSLDCVAPMPSQSGFLVAHGDLRNVVPTLRTTNWAVGNRSRFATEILTTLTALVPVIHHLERTASDRTLNQLEKDALEYAQQLVQDARSANESLRHAEGAFGIFKRLRKVATVSVDDVSFSHDPFADFLAVLSRIEKIHASFIKARPDEEDPLPGTSAFYCKNFEEFSNIDPENLQSSFATADEILGEHQQLVPVYAPFPESSRPRVTFESQEEQARVRKLVEAIEKSKKIKQINPRFSGFAYLSDGSGWPAFVSPEEIALWEQEQGRKLTLEDLLAEAGFRMLRVLEKCDLKYREHPDADPLDGYFGNLLVDLYLQFALGEHEDLLLGKSYLLAKGNAYSAGIGHRLPKRPMTFGVSKPRPTRLKDYNFNDRNMQRRNWDLTRHFTVQLQAFASDADRKKAIQAYGHALSHWLKKGRFKSLDADKQEVLSAALDAFYASPVYNWLGPWRARGLIYLKRVAA